MVEMAEVFRRYGPQYRQKYGERMLSSHRRVMWAIEHCRTEALGGHVYYCETCDETHYSYHSCRNRHCPKCQNEKGEQWLEKQGASLLSVPYFMLTFTLPAELRSASQMARQHQKLFYNLLFRASAAATQKLARDPRFVGGKIGMVGVLHTWGRNLSYHPHVHYLVPSGALAADGETWLPARKDFLLPVKALSKLFRAKFRGALRKTEYFADIPASVWSQNWVMQQVAGRQAQPASQLLEGLSEREVEVLRLIAHGLSNAEIAARLYLSEGTVRNHVSAILAKLNVPDRTNAAILAIQAGLG